jgi:8-amino-7-oxononanoate synthase
MTGSRLVNGTMRLHKELEDKLAAYHGKEAGLVFTTGYQVNIATISALLANKKSVAVIDKDDHASIYDGVRLAQAAGAKMVRYKHSDPAALDQALSELEDSEGALVVTDGVFSAQGEIANLPGIVEVTKKHKARILVDDAHALGVIGPGGRGTAAHFGVADQVDLIGGTFSKSLASIGGFVAATESVIHYLKHHSRPLIFTASLPPANTAGVLAALEVLQHDPERRERLWANTRRLHEGFRQLGYDIGPTQTPIVPVLIGPMEKTFLFWRKLFDAGVFTNPVAPPAVPPSQCRLRTSLMATHTFEQIDYALDVFARIGRELEVI